MKPWFAVIFFSASLNATSLIAGINNLWHITAESVAPGGNGASAVVFDGDENVIVTGTMARGGLGEDFYTAKYSTANGDLIWSSVYDGPQHEGDSPYSIGVDSENHVIVAGSSSGDAGIVDCVVIKYNATNGAPMWTNRLDRNYSTYGNSIRIDSNGDVFAIGFQQTGPDNTDILTLKLNGANGEIIWQRTYDGPTNSLDHGYRALLDANDDIVVVGSSTGSNTRRDFLVTKYNGTNGSVVWQTRHNVSGSQDAIPVDGFISENGNIYVTGDIVFEGQGTICTVCLNGANGEIVWSNAELLASGKSATASDITANSEGIATVAGTVFEDFSSRITTITYSETGTIQWRFEDDNEMHSNGMGVSVVNSSANSTIVLGHVRDLGNENARKICLIKHYLEQPEPEFTHKHNLESPTSFWGTALAFSPNQRIAVAGLSWSTNGAESDITTSVFFLARNPIVFIPGIAGSILKEQVTPQFLWQRWPPGLVSTQSFPPGFKLSMRDDLNALNLRLNAGKNMQATGVLRKFWEDIPDGLENNVEFLQKNVVYGPFIDHLVNDRDYIEFPSEKDPRELSTDFLLDYVERHPNEPIPTLFAFPYDWRKSNADHTAALHDYISRISEFHGGAKVDIVAHSMGGLLSRRYLLDHGSSKVDKIVTVASPFWGAPVAIYRMFTGEFFDSPLDLISPEPMKNALVTLPGAIELLPSSAYVQQTYLPNGRVSTLIEDGWDFDGNGRNDQGYLLPDYWPIINRNIRDIQNLSNIGGVIPNSPSASKINADFHDEIQDSSHTDGVTFPNLSAFHIYGKQVVDATPKSILIKARSSWNPRSLFNYYYFDKKMGPGDGTVPTLSAARIPSYVSPGAEMRQVLGHGDADHNGLMKNSVVWNYVDDFLDDGVLNLSAALPDATPSVAEIEFVSRRIQILVLGANYVSVVDGNGNRNTQISDVGSLKIPDVDIVYGGEQPWVIIEFDAATAISIESGAESTALEIQSTGFDATGTASALLRYRFEPEHLSWRLDFANILEDSTLRLDLNEDGNFGIGETVAATHEIVSGTVDIEQPRVSLQLAVSGETITITLTGEDGEQPTPDLYYSVDAETLQRYTEPQEFAIGSGRILKAYAEDAAGNTSGLIETAIHPDLSLDANSGGTVTLTWPISDAYVLEESTSLEEGNWAPSQSPITREGFEDRTTIPTESATRKFFRLRSRAVTK